MRYYSPPFLSHKISPNRNGRALFSTACQYIPSHGLRTFLPAEPWPNGVLVLKVPERRESKGGVSMLQDAKEEEDLEVSVFGCDTRWERMLQRCCGWSSLLCIFRVPALASSKS